MSIETNKIRNVAIIGHSGEGKTTLCEALLFAMKSTDRQGKVEDGNTVMDFHSEEIAKKSSISLAVASGFYKDIKINIIDTPGFFDFESEMALALSVADSAIIVTGASGTLTVGTEKALDFCAKNKIPALIYITALDKENSNYLKTVDSIREKYPSRIASMFMPYMVDSKFNGWVGVARGRLFSLTGEDVDTVPTEMKEIWESEYTSLSEVAAGNDEALLDKFFAEGKLLPEEIEKGVKIGVMSCGCVPVFGGSGAQNKGVENLLEKIYVLLPNPTESKPEIATMNDEEVEIPCSDDGSVLLKVFKTIVDPFVGKLNMFKVIRGTLNVGVTLKNTVKGKEEKIGAIYLVKGKKQESVQSIVAGDIGALAKLGDVSTGDTLSELDAVIFKHLNLAKPMYTMAVFAAVKGEEDKVFAGLNKLKDEDISFEVSKNSETGEMLLSGIGETQISVLCKKLKNKFGCEAVLKEPKIAYRETIKKMAEAEGRHKKQSGGAGQFGVCSVRFEPGAEDGVYEFVDAVVGGAVPKQFIPAVDKGLRESIKEGVLAGYPVVNLKCTLFDGKYHPVDSKEIAFTTAAKLSFQEGFMNASPCILEPIMRVEITIPDDYLGAILGDMNKRRGRILGTETVDGKQVVLAEAPQSELVKYATDLRSMTQARGFYTAEFSKYEEVPIATQEKIIAESNAKRIKTE